MLSQHTTTMEAANQTETFHKLSHTWTLWSHMPHNTDWSLKSYDVIFKMTTVEETIAILQVLSSVVIENCMLFIMRDGINPMWEDPKNRNGGCFSYKVLNPHVASSWIDLTYCLVGNSISNNSSFVKNVTGITISPKKNFCIVKIWMANCDHQNPALVVDNIVGLQAKGCIFKKHIPEY